MFIVAQTKDKTITWPVTVEVAANGGKIVKHTFDGTFRVLDDAERKELFPDVTATAQLDAEDVADDAQVTAVAVDWKEESVDNILKIMTGWKSVVDEKKVPIEFNRETLLAAARSASGVALLRGINTAIAEISTGARAKN
jgi:hypothetical protein